MDFTLDGEQTALRDAVRGLLKGYDAEHRREVVAEDPGFDEAMWGRLAEMGVLGLPVRRGRRRHGRRTGRGLPRRRGVRPGARPRAVRRGRGAGRRPGRRAAAATSRRRRSSAACRPGSWCPRSPGPTRPAARAGVTVDGDTLTGVKEPVLNGGRADLLVVLRRGPAVPGRAPTRTRARRRTRPSTAAAPPASPSTRPRPPRWARAVTPPRRPRTSSPRPRSPTATRRWARWTRR